MRRAAMPVGVLQVAGACLRAELRLDPVLDNHMVVQRGKAVRVWGWADAGETIAVESAGQKKTATATADGAWALALDNLDEWMRREWHKAAARERWSEGEVGG